MAEYVEREAAIEICSNQYKECLRKNDWCGDTIAWNIGFGIKAIPATDVQPVVHGRWERTEDGAAYCTHCRRKMNPSQYGYAFCALCGAKMEGGQDE